jgi:hypothetical protein
MAGDACNKQRDEELKNGKVKAKIFTRLLYRHWNAFTEFKRSHLFVVSAESGADFQSVGQAGVAPAESQSADSMSAGPTAGTAAPRDLTPGDDDVPPFNLGGQDMYAARRKSFGLTNGNSAARRGRTASFIENGHRIFSPTNSRRPHSPHGQLDYRLDVSEGFQLFTTLQKMKVPSKFLYFPDEGHWVLKPQNSRLWYKTVNDWVNQWCK